MFFKYFILANWLGKKEDEYDRREKARLCAPCDNPCGKALCQKIGCLNMDMRTNAVRLQILVNRLEETGYVFPIDRLRNHLAEGADEAAKGEFTNVVKMSDFRKDDEPADH